MFFKKKEKSSKDPSGGAPDGTVFGFQSPGLHCAAHELALFWCKTLKREPGEGHGEHFPHLLIRPKNWAGFENAYKRDYGKTTETEILLQSSQESSVARVYAHLLLKFPEGCGLEVKVRGIFPTPRQSYFPWMELQVAASADQEKIRLPFLYPKQQDHCGRREPGELGQRRIMD